MEHLMILRVDEMILSQVAEAGEEHAALVVDKFEGKGD